MAPAWPLLLAVFCGILAPSSTLNILGLFPHPGKSHFDVFEPLLRELALKGHNVTVLSYFPRQTPLERYRDVNLQGDAGVMVNVINIDDFPKNRLVYYTSPVFLAVKAKESCERLHTNQVQQFMREDHKFDLIITEMFNTECFLGFVHKYQVPFIGLSSCTIMPWTNSRLGNPLHPGYIPVNLLPFSDRMSFVERLENTVFYVYSEILFKYFMGEPGYVEAKKVFGDDLPRPSDIASNVSLLLVNSHFSLNLARPLVPNIIEVGGMYLPKVKKVPQNIEKFISGSSHGTIYFSMGSLIKAHTFPEDKRNAFLGAFGKLRQRVLWKWENETMPGKPDNVKIQKWMPQFDILCHPNTVAFIAHGGLLGVTEAVHCGVPIVLIPQFGDQFTNAKAVEANGAGVILPFKDITEESVLSALNTVLDPKFRKQAKDLSAAYRDRPLSAMDTAVYWVEYVARHGGAPFMRSAAVDMPLHQYLLLDVAAFIFIILGAIALILYQLLRLILGFVLRGNEQKLKAH